MQFTSQEQLLNVQHFNFYSLFFITNIICSLQFFMSNSLVNQLQSTFHLHVLHWWLSALLLLMWLIASLLFNVHPHVMELQYGRHRWLFPSVENWSSPVFQDFICSWFFSSKLTSPCYSYSNIIYSFLCFSFIGDIHYYITFRCTT